MLNSFYYKYKEPKNIFSVQLMNKKKLNALISLYKNDDIHENQKKFMIPGMLSANTELEECFRNFRSPLENEGKFCKVVFKI